MTTAQPATPTLGEIRGRMALVLDLLPGLTDQQRRVARLMLRNTASALWVATGELVTWVGVPTITQAILFSEEEPASAEGLKKRLMAIQRAVKRARARLIEVGLLDVVAVGGHGPGSTTRYRFSLELMERVERAARQIGLLQRFGGVGEAVTLTVDGKGDSQVYANDIRQGDADATLSARRRGSKAAAPVDIKAAPVDIPPESSDTAPLRVTGVTRKGDSGDAARVTAAPPEHLTKPDQPRRGRARGVDSPSVDRRQREMRLLRPVGGGLVGAVDAVERGAQAKRDAQGDRRHDTVLQRAGALLGDGGLASLAVSALPTETVARLRSGWSPSDGVLRQLLDEAIGTLRASGLLGGGDVSTTGEAAGIGALRSDIRALQDQVNGLVRLVGTLLGGGGARAAAG